MKKLFTILAAVLISASVFAQTPQKMSYQAVIRKTNGDLLQSSNVGMRVSILRGSTTGAVVYQEVYNPNPQTNVNGLVSIEIGSGAILSGKIDTINWASNSYFIKIETDPAGGSNYTITSTSQLLSVPFAFFAAKSGNSFSGSYNDLVNKPNFSTVATSGSYTDLKNKPTLSVTGDSLKLGTGNSVAINTIIPAGSIMPYVGTTAPSGWLLCDGSLVNRSTYTKLFASIGTAFGIGDGSTTFNLPDLRGRFMRGVDGSAGNDPDNSTRTASNTGGNVGNTVGSVQSDALKSHTHSENMNYAGSGNSGGTCVVTSSNGTNFTAYPYITNATGVNETRPKNVYVNYIIKY